MRIQTVFADAGLGKLERVGVVRRDGAFDDHRLLLRRPMVALARRLVAVTRSRCGDVLPDIGERRLVQPGREVRQKQAKRGWYRDRMEQYEGLTGRVRQVQARASLGQRAEGIVDRLRLGRPAYSVREFASVRLHHTEVDFSGYPRPRPSAEEEGYSAESIAEIKRAHETRRAR